jgi:ribosomal protein S18 acetylase RimI-like enzyme
MMKTELVPFTDEMVPAAGKLLAGRHTRNRESLALLPARFEDPQVAAKAVKALWEKKQRNGYGAFRDGRMSAYLLGEHVTQPWGRCGYVYLPGYALDEGESTKTLQNLYARLGDDWVRKGVFSHGLYISAADQEVIAALFDLGFGKERVDALLDLRGLEIPEHKEPEGITVRRAGKGDNPLLGGISDVISRALAQPPYWHPTIPEDWEGLREGWSELADEKDWTIWMALDQDELLGMVGFTTQEATDTDMLASPRTAYLSVAATKPQARGRGISTYLTWRGLEQARKDGFEVCYTNWISSNFLAARHWPRYGFGDVAYRLAKRIDPMISWAK